MWVRGHVDLNKKPHSDIRDVNLHVEDEMYLEINLNANRVAHVSNKVPEFYMKVLGTSKSYSLWGKIGNGLFSRAIF